MISEFLSSIIVFILRCPLLALRLFLWERALGWGRRFTKRVLMVLFCVLFLFIILHNKNKCSSFGCWIILVFRRQSSSFSVLSVGGWAHFYLPFVHRLSLSLSFIILPIHYNDVLLFDAMLVTSILFLPLSLSFFPVPLSFSVCRFFLSDRDRNLGSDNLQTN